MRRGRGRGRGGATKGGGYQDNRVRGGVGASALGAIGPKSSSSGLKRKANAGNEEDIQYENLFTAKEEDLLKAIGKPISEADPTKAELEESIALKGLLNKVSDSKKKQKLQAIRRKTVIEHVHGFATTWVQQACGVSRERSDDHVRVLKFGSYCLGVDTSHSDIDLLLLCSNVATAEDFLEEFGEVVKQNPKTSDLQVISDTLVPVVKFGFMGEKVDVVFASLASETITASNEDLLSDDILSLCEDKSSVYGLNGYRVSERILRLVPDVGTFRTVLMVVKRWAILRGIYSNKLGFLGGVNWAILVGKVCQMYPKASASFLVRRFFMVYSQWKWPKPVMLSYMRQTDKNSLHRNLQWNPISDPRNRMDIMPLVTPAYPEMNSSRNVTKSTLRILRYELSRAFRILNDSLVRKETEGNSASDGGSSNNITSDSGSDAHESLWRKLIGEPFSFFDSYNHFLQLKVTGLNQTELLAWEAYVFSKLRVLVKSLQDYDNLWPRPFPVGFSNPKNDLCSYFFIALEYDLHKPSSGESRFAGKRIKAEKNLLKLDVTNALHSFASLLEYNYPRLEGMDLTCQVISVPASVRGADRSKYFDSFIPFEPAKIETLYLNRDD